MPAPLNGTLSIPSAATSRANRMLEIQSVALFSILQEPENTIHAKGTAPRKTACCFVHTAAPARIANHIPSRNLYPEDKSRMHQSAATVNTMEGYSNITSPPAA